ncbi:MAG TPA: hypothetical protein VG206_20515 [Terriglobia bacterium]|nr:hypothetical protein [Terriglobia bacterium]
MRFSAAAALRMSVSLLALSLTTISGALRGADNLKLAPGLDFMKNAYQGPAITGDKMWDGIEKGKPNYIFMYGEFCYDAKRQAQRTVEMYRDYGDRVHFVIIDLSRPIAKVEQIPLVKKYYTGLFPHTTILDKNGKVVLDYTGEIDDATLIGWMDAAVQSGDEANDQKTATK